MKLKDLAANTFFRVSSLTSEVKEGCRYFLYFFYEATKQLENFLLTLFQQGRWNTEYG